MIFSPLPHKLAAGGIFLKIWISDELSGSCQWEDAGLYYALMGEIPNQEGRVCRLVGIWKEKTVPLGIMIPKGNRMILQKRVAKKSLNPEETVFLIEMDGKQFFPIRNGKCYALEKLEEGSYAKKADIYGILKSNSTGQ